MRSCPVLLSAMLLSQVACGEPDGPGIVYRSYLAALSGGDLEGAFDLLSKDSQRRLAALEADWRRERARPSEATAEARASSHPGFEYFRARVAGPAGEDYPPLPEDAADLVESVSVQGSRAVVYVRTPLGLREAGLVLQDGEWRVDLVF